MKKNEKSKQITTDEALTASANIPPSQFDASAPIQANDIFPRSYYVSSGVYTNKKTSIADFKTAIVPLTTKGDLFVFSTQNTRLGVGSDNQFLVADSAQATGMKWIAAPLSVFGRTGAVTAQSGDYTAAQVTNAADKSSASAQVFTGNIQAPIGLFGVSPNAYNTSQSATTFLVVNPSTPAQQLVLGWDATNQVGYLQAITQGVSVKPLALNPSGAAVGVGYAVNHVYTRSFEVSGTALFSSNVLFNNGITITESGGGIQFNSSGGFTTDDGMSFYVGNQYYRIGFDDIGGTVGIIRQNVDIANSTHGFGWSSGTVPNTNFLAMLWAGGKFVLGTNAHTLSQQSLMNIYGDLYLGNVSTPSAPTAGGKLHSELVSGVSTLFYMDSTGVNHQLTGGSGSPVLSVFGRSGVVTAQTGDYTQNQITNLTTTSSPLFAAVSVTNDIFLTAASSPTQISGGNYLYAKSDGHVYVMPPTGGGPEKSITKINGRTSTGVDVNGPSDDLICLDSTSGANLFNVDATLITRPLIISWTAGASLPQIQPASGKTINGGTGVITLNIIYAGATFVQSSTDPNDAVIVARLST